jgi:hypothetical protein
MKRRDFIKRVGIGSVAVAGLPTLVDTLVTPASAAGKVVGFRFVSNSRTATVGGVRHQALLNGDGRITPGQVVGGGSFNHIIDTSSVPKTIVASGTWKAKQLLFFGLVGSYGALAAGIVEMLIHLVPEGGAPVEAFLELVCNLGPAGLFTGEEEGFVLSIPGTEFVLGGTFGPFLPFVPVAGGPTSGLSVFNLLNEQRN